LNSDLYDHPALYDALLPVGAHLPYYAELARQASGDILELACGTGQLTVPLAGAGVRIAGLDLSEPMLRTARERAATAKVSVEFVPGDMRNFSLGRQFALIFIARNSLLHLHSTDDILATFAAVRRHLMAGGISRSIYSIRMFACSRGLQASAFPFFKRKLNRSASFQSRKQPTMILPRKWAVAVGTFRLPETRMPGYYLSSCEIFFRRSCRCYSRRGAFTSRVVRKILSKRRSIPPAACKCVSVRQ
jgi:SAM-dependent methyltransferase